MTEGLLPGLPDTFYLGRPRDAVAERVRSVQVELRGDLIQFAQLRGGQSQIDVFEHHERIVGILEVLRMYVGCT